MAISPLLSLISSDASLLLGLTTRSHNLRLFLFLPLTILLSLHSLFNALSHSSDLATRVSISPLATNFILRSLELLVCSGDPHLAFRRLRDGETRISEASFAKRLFWAIELSATTRGTGWNWRVRGTPPSTTISNRFIFLLYKIPSFIAYTVAYEATILALKQFGLSNAPPGPLILVFGAALITGLNMYYELMSILWALLVPGDIQDFPPLFGSIKDAATLRGFWGHFWHQTFRHSITVIPNSALSVLGLGPDTTGIGAFLLTGIFHATITYSISFNTHFFYSFLFFALQPLGFFIEQHILQIHRWTSRIAKSPPQHCTNSPSSSDPTNRNSGPTGVAHTPWTHWLGYVWVTTWLTLTLTPYAHEVIASRYYDVPGLHSAPIPILERYL